jgi:hypothetical protein
MVVKVDERSAANKSTLPAFACHTLAPNKRRAYTGLSSPHAVLSAKPYLVFSPYLIAYSEQFKTIGYVLKRKNWTSP